MTQQPTTQQSPAQQANIQQEGPDLRTGDIRFDDYAAAFAAGETPLLGQLVLYSVFDGEVTRDQLVVWFAELGLDPALLPEERRPVDVYEKVTGTSGVRRVYDLAAPLEDVRDRRRRLRNRGQSGGLEKEATLMLRTVSRDRRRIVRKVVREVRDAAKTRLSYDTDLASAIFHHDPDQSLELGQGQLEVVPNETAIGKLPELERSAVRTMLGEIESQYRHYGTYLDADRLRKIVRDYIEGLRGVKVRKSGGVYFIWAEHAATLAALRELVARFGGDSHLVRIPLPNQAEMREMVRIAVTTKATEDLNKLAGDIAAARRDGATDAVTANLHKRFRALTESTREHSELLQTSLDDTQASLQLVNAQLASLLTAPPADDDSDTDD